jgi:hypothetical protein
MTPFPGVTQRKRNERYNDHLSDPSLDGKRACNVHQKAVL